MDTVLLPAALFPVLKQICEIASSIGNPATPTEVVDLQSALKESTRLVGDAIGNADLGSFGVAEPKVIADQMGD